MIRLLILALLLGGLLPSAEARLSHVSINKSQFTLGEHPRLRVNIVSERSDFSRLEFVVRQSKGEEKLMVEPLNNFMLLLTGVENVSDSAAQLVVREYVVNQWREAKVIPLFSEAKGLVPLTPKPRPQAQVPVKVAAVSGNLSASASNTQTPQIKSAPVTDNEPEESCSVDYQQGETLWRIASRYAPRWNTNVYATMLALFDANPKAFNKGKIGGLKQNAKLDCPSPALLARYPDITDAKLVFEASEE
ncbi:FimV/HubP family polar landmark protein [Shewanella sp.]|uniref:FimV/HubP family polar landmark protein n=1 Tax=Shewanella sp. TaxID=50422 RepID=UPI00356A5354